MARAESPLAVCVAGEDSAHSLLITRLSDSVLLFGREGSEAPDTVRRFVPEDGPCPVRFDTRNATRRLKEIEVPSRRPFYRSSRLGGEGEGECRGILDAIDLAKMEIGRVDVILILIDEDGRPSRMRAFGRLRVHFKGLQTGPAVIPGICVPTAESWIVALLGGSREHHQRLAALNMAFHPAEQPHSLVSQPHDAPHHVKRVLNALLDGECHPLHRYSADTPPFHRTEPALAAVVLNPDRLCRLRECGIGAFIEDLRTRYLPLAGGALPG